MPARVPFLPVLLTAIALGCASPATVPEPGTDALELGELLASDDAGVRARAVATAGTIGPAAIVPIAPQLASSAPQAARCAELALWCIAHHSCRADAGDDRDAASAACLQLLAQQPPLPRASQLVLVAMLGVLADQPWSVERLAAHAAQPEIGEAVVRALERIPHPAAEAALAAIARDRSAPHRARAVAALAAKSGAAASVLLEVAQEGDAELARIARHGLARLGEPGARELLSRAANGGEQAATDDLLALAEHRARAGDAKSARAIYLTLLDARPSSVRTAAILGLGAVADRDATLRLVAELAGPAPDVRAAAESALVASADPDLEAQLRRTLEFGPAAARASALRLLVQRRTGRAADLLRAAVGDTQPDVRVEALQLLGTVADRSVAALLLQCAERNSDERPIALDSYLAQAEATLRAGDASAALEMLHRVLAMRAPASVIARALRGVAMIASPTSLALLAPLAARDDCRDELARARFAIAGSLAATDRATAIATLEALTAEASSRRDRQRAAAKLAALGVDTSNLGRSRGCLTDWHLIGAFPEATAGDFEQQPFGTDAIALAAAVASSGGELHWQPHHTADIDGIVDLAHVFAKSEHACAYAWAEIDSPAERAATLKVGSDDGVAVWLNGTLVLARNVARGITVDEDQVPVTLRAGKNSLLLKVNQGGGDWGFCVRLER